MCCPDCGVNHDESECIDSLPQFFVVEHTNCPRAWREGDWSKGFGFWDRLTDRLAPLSVLSFQPRKPTVVLWTSYKLEWVNYGSRYIERLLSVEVLVKNG